MFVQGWAQDSNLRSPFLGMVLITCPLAVRQAWVSLAPAITWERGSPCRGHCHPLHTYLTSLWLNDSLWSAGLLCCRISFSWKKLGPGGVRWLIQLESELECNPLQKGPEIESAVFIYFFFWNATSKKIENVSRANQAFDIRLLQLQHFSQVRAIVRCWVCAVWFLCATRPLGREGRMWKGTKEECWQEHLFRTQSLFCPLPSLSS